MILKFVLFYWILTTIYGVYWLIKNPRVGQDPKYFTLVDVIGNILPAMCLSWFFMPIMILESIKFKR